MKHWYVQQTYAYTTPHNIYQNANNNINALFVCLFSASMLVLMYRYTNFWIDCSTYNNAIAWSCQLTLSSMQAPHQSNNNNNKIYEYVLFQMYNIIRIDATQYRSFYIGLVWVRAYGGFQVQSILHPITITDWMEIVIFPTIECRKV